MGETELRAGGPHQTSRNGIDVTAFLKEVMEKCVWFYRQDFDHDITILREAAENVANKKEPYYWLGRPGGTWCLKEREVFLRGSPSHSIWTYYEPESTGIRAFRVELHGIADGKIMGDITAIDYPKQVQRVKEMSLPIDTVTAIFQNGKTLTMPWEEFCRKRLSLRGLYGDLLCQTYHPKNEEALGKLLALEHKIQQRQSKHATGTHKIRIGEEKTR